MNLLRRKLFALSGLASLAGVANAAQAPRASETSVSALGLDAAQMGVRPGSPDDQTSVIQRAIDRATQARVPLVLPPGTYRTGILKLASGARLVGIPGATRLTFAGGSALITGDHAEGVSLTGLTFDGMLRPLPPNQGLVHFEQTTGLRIVDCVIMSSGRHGIRLAWVQGEVTGTAIPDAADVALLSSDGRGVVISRSIVTNAGNNAIQIIRTEGGHDGTQVLDNRIENTRNHDGGSGQFGNAINAYRAADVMVRGNLIRRCAFSGVRGNASSNIQIIGNTVQDAGETALYSEFAFEGAVVAQNIVDGAQTGVSIANFNEGGRMAVVQGNIFRNLAPQHPNPPPDDLYGVGIYAEADTTISGNVVDDAQAAGIAIGWGPYLRNVAVTGNVVRKAPIGIAVSAVPGAGVALISANVISQFMRGAVVGMDHARPITGDLAAEGARPPSHLLVTANRAG